MASDMSGYQGEEGKRRWLQESGGTSADYSREMSAWQASQGQPAEAAAPAPAQAPAGGGGGGGGGGTSSQPLPDWTPTLDAANRALQDAKSDGQPVDLNWSNEQKLAWFKAAADAGAYTERGGNTSKEAYQETYNYNATGEDVTGLRKRAKEGNWSEDMSRWSETQLRSWMQDLDPTCPPDEPFKSREDGSCVQKPIDSHGSRLPGGAINPEWQAEQAAGGPGGGGGRGGQGGRPGGGPPPPPPAPTTFGSNLSYTGNPLTDMLLYQFNTGTQMSDPSKMNIFNMGEDRQEGGEGKNADQQQRTGQLLQGGGLWWSNDKEAFGGFRADTKNADPLAAAAGAAPAPAAPGGAAPSGGSGGVAQHQNTGWSENVGGLPIPQSQPQETPISGMLMKQNEGRTWRERAGGNESPFNMRQAF